MSYTDAAALLGHGTVAAEAIDAWFAKHGQCPAGLGAAIVAECAAAGVNHDLVAAQTALESGYWTSAIAHDKNNPAGIGAENDDPYGKAITFSSVAAGIHAQVEHLLTYVLGDGPWGADDPRFAAVKAQGWLGSVKVLRDLNGKWAFPGTSYGADIAAWANALLDFANNGTWGPTMDAQTPGFIWQPADAKHFEAGRTAKVIGGAQHYSDGTNSLTWLTTSSGADDPKLAVSAHLLVYHTPTLTNRGHQLVRLEDTAWATSQANPYTVAIEYEHDGKQPIPDIAYEVLAQTWVDVDTYLRTHGLGAISAIRGHKEWVNDPTKICPDGIDVARIQARFNEIKGGNVPTPQPASGADPVTGKYIDTPFVAYFHEHGDVEVFGRPVTGSFIDPTTGLLTQFFERNVFELHPDGVKLRRLGAQAAAAAGFTGAGIP